MGFLEKVCNATFVFAPLSPPFAYRKNVDASDENCCSGIVVFIFNQDE